MITTLNTRVWDEHFDDFLKKEMVQQLEQGQVIYFPELAFQLLSSEKQFLSPHYVDKHAKNISYHPIQNKLWGVQQLTDQQYLELQHMMFRFSQHAHELIKNLLPRYTEHLILARTSFRPVQISDRKTSYRKDDRRLHVDAFPSAPNQGKRILRVFCNINPHGESRVWRLGESFDTVAQQFIPHVKQPLFGSAALLRLLKITKSYRTLYDHYMLQMHDMMKANNDYQKNAKQETVHFAAGSTWIVQTDHVSHAAMSGQHVLEQTFYLPIAAMHDPALSPLRVLEKIAQRELV